MNLHVDVPDDAPDIRVGQFAVASQSSLQERRPRTLKHGEHFFGVFDRNGDVLSGEGSPEGLFHRDTRQFSHLDLLINGARPILLSSTVRDDNAVLTCDLTNPDLYDEAGRLLLEHDVIHIRRSKFLWKSACFERLLVRNFGGRPERLTLELRFEADFADLFEVRGTRRTRRGTFHPADVTSESVTLTYSGLDDRTRMTRSASTRLRPGSKRDAPCSTSRLRPGSERVIFVEICCDDALLSGARASTTCCR